MTEPSEMAPQPDNSVSFGTAERAYLYVDGERITSTETSSHRPAVGEDIDQVTRLLLVNSAIADTETLRDTTRSSELFVAGVTIGTLATTGAIGVAASIFYQGDWWKAGGSAMALVSGLTAYDTWRGYRKSKRNEGFGTLPLTQRLSKLRGFLGTITDIEVEQTEQTQS